jgi:2'-5' RNA ligase
MTHGNRNIRVVPSNILPGRPEHKLVDTYDEIKDGPFGKGYFILPNGKLADVTDDFIGSGDESHVGWLIASDNYKLFGLSESDADYLRTMFTKTSQSKRDWEKYDKVWEKIFTSGIVRVREWHNEISIEVNENNNNTLRKIQSLVDNDKIGLSVGKEIIISGWSKAYDNIYTNYGELMSAKYVVGEELKQSKQIIITKGGPGSGHWGHAGRPGKVGGSLPKGGPGRDIFRPSIGVHTSSWDDMPPLYPGEHDPINDFLNQGLEREVSFVYGSLKYANWAATSYDKRGELKADIVSELSKRTGVDEDTVNKIIKQWANTSNDKDMRSLSLQAAAAEEFGVEMSEWQLEHYDQFLDWDYIQMEIDDKEKEKFDWLMDQRNKLRAAGVDNPLTQASLRDVREEAKRLAEVLVRERYATHAIPITSRNDERLVLRAMYDYTQQEFMKAGFSQNDYVTIWRGIGKLDVGRHNDLAGYKGNAIESWSASYKVALDFRNLGGDVVGALVPVRNIIGTCKTGFGCLSEGEIVTLGTIPGMRVRVVDPGEIYQQSKKQDYSDTAMVALPVSNSKITKLWERYGSDKNVLPLHITLLYLGDVEELDKGEIVNILKVFAKQQAPIKGKYNGGAIFTDNGDGYPHVLLFDSPQLPFCHSNLSKLLSSHRPELTHGFTPHTTLAYNESPKSLPVQIDVPYTFNEIILQWGGDSQTFPLQGTVIEKSKRQIRIIKGGPGSGHHGHRGRPGKRGGSLPADSLPHVSSDKKDVKLSNQLAKECGAIAKECYKNSAMALVRVKGGKYVEGYFVIDFGDFQYPVEHGWIEKSDGKIVDITLPDDIGVYIPANSWTFKEVMSKVDGDTTLPFSNYKDENWAKAAVQAWGMLGVKIEKGGPGSGHFGHAGRPGKVGGSTPSKGSKKRLDASAAASANSYTLDRADPDPRDNPKEIVEGRRMSWHNAMSIVNKTVRKQSAFNEPPAEHIKEMYANWLTYHDVKIGNQLRYIVVPENAKEWRDEYDRTFHDKKYKYVTGFFNRDYDQIVIKPRSADLMADVFHHEMGHLAHKHSKTFNTWSKRYIKDDDFDRHTYYSNKDWKEGFAESYMSFIVNESFAPGDYQDTYDAVQEVIDGVS